jgi:NADH:ubiquinone oxidoreductase subunit 2 (subunit N)
VLAYFVVVFGVIAASSNNLLLLFLCLEGVSLSAYLLALSSQTFGGVSASAKYFVFGSLGSVFML